MSGKIDVVIFGASGFTGKHCIPQIVKFTKNTEVTWGVAGRTSAKLRAALESYQTEIVQAGRLINDIPILIADITDEASLRAMARRANVIINCSGPFLLYGEPVVKACVEEGAHYIDVTGESPFMKQMKEKYDVKAREKGVYVISACGFDCIPSDLGVCFLEKNFQGTLNSVDVYMGIEQANDSGFSGFLNYSTFASIVLIFGKYFSLRDIFETSNLKPTNSIKLLPHRRDFLKGWALPFPATDRDVIKSSQNSFFKDTGKRPIQPQNYALVDTFLNAVLSIFFVSIIILLSQFEFGRKLLLKYPGFFTNGLITHDNPKEETIENNSFTFTFYGTGLKNDKIMGQVKGKNAGYGTTCICLVLSALTILTEREKIPKCGVISPGYAFAETSLIEKLHKNGVIFEIL